HLLAPAEPHPKRRIEVREHGGRIGPRHREVLPLDAQFLVGAQVVGRRQQGHHPVEPLLADPDDLFLAPHATVGAGVTTGAFTDGETVFDDPREVPGRDALGPLPLHAAATSRAAWMVARTSCTRTIAAPFCMAHTARASEP